MYKSKVENKAYYSIMLMLISMIIIRFWGLFFIAPSIIKLLYSTLIYISVIIYPYALLKNNEFISNTKTLLYLLFIVSIYEIFVSVFNTSPSMYAFGNKWITLFGNEYTTMLFFPPLYIFLSSIKKIPKILGKGSLIYALCCFAILLNGKNAFGYISITLILFWPYVAKKYKILIIITYIMTIKQALDGTRMFLIVTAFALFSYIIIYILKEKFLKTFIILVLLSIPILFIPTLFLEDFRGDNNSYFHQVQTFFAEKKGKEDIGADTRTFLYVEMAQDLSNKNSWLLGKGAFSHYDSPYFNDNKLGKFGRITSEVPFLNYLLRGGIIYTSLYFGILLYAIWSALKYGKNKFIKSIAVIITGWIFNSFVGDITGCSYYHIVFFILVGCCLNKNWLNYSDQDIKSLLRIKTLRL